MSEEGEFLGEFMDQLMDEDSSSSEREETSPVPSQTTSHERKTQASPERSQEKTSTTDPDSAPHSTGPSLDSTVDETTLSDYAKSLGNGATLSDIDTAPVLVDGMGRVVEESSSPSMLSLFSAFSFPERVKTTWKQVSSIENVVSTGSSMLRAAVSVGSIPLRGSWSGWGLMAAEQCRFIDNAYNEFEGDSEQHQQTTVTKERRKTGAELEEEASRSISDLTRALSAYILLLFASLTLFIVAVIGRGSLILTLLSDLGIGCMAVAAFACANITMAILLLRSSRRWVALIQVIGDLRERFRESDAWAAKAIRFVKELEIVSRGYNLSSPVPPISRIDYVSQRFHLEPLRSLLASSLQSQLNIMAECSHLACSPLTSTSRIARSPKTTSTAITEGDSIRLGFAEPSIARIAELREAHGLVRRYRRTLIKELVTFFEQNTPQVRQSTDFSLTEFLHPPETWWDHTMRRITQSVETALSRCRALMDSFSTDTVDHLESPLQHLSSSLASDTRSVISVLERPLRRTRRSAGDKNSSEESSKLKDLSLVFGGIKPLPENAPRDVRQFYRLLITVHNKLRSGIMRLVLCQYRDLSPVLSSEEAASLSEKKVRLDHIDEDHAAVVGGKRELQKEIHSDIRFLDATVVDCSRLLRQLRGVVKALGISKAEPDNLVRRPDVVAKSGGDAMADDTAASHLLRKLNETLKGIRPTRGTYEADGERGLHTAEERAALRETADVSTEENVVQMAISMVTELESVLNHRRGGPVDLGDGPRLSPMSDDDDEAGRAKGGAEEEEEEKGEEEKKTKEQLTGRFHDAKEDAKNTTGRGSGLHGGVSHSHDDEDSVDHMRMTPPSAEANSLLAELMGSGAFRRPCAIRSEEVVGGGDDEEESYGDDVHVGSGEVVLGGDGEGKDESPFIHSTMSRPGVRRSSGRKRRTVKKYDPTPPVKTSTRKKSTEKGSDVAPKEKRQKKKKKEKEEEGKPMQEKKKKKSPGRPKKIPIPSHTSDETTLIPIQEYGSVGVVTTVEDVKGDACESKKEAAKVVKESTSSKKESETNTGEIASDEMKTSETHTSSLSIVPSTPKTSPSASKKTPTSLKKNPTTPSRGRPKKVKPIPVVEQAKAIETEVGVGDVSLSQSSSSCSLPPSSSPETSPSSTTKKTSTIKNGATTPSRGRPKKVKPTPVEVGSENNNSSPVMNAEESTTKAAETKSTEAVGTTMPSSESKPSSIESLGVQKDTPTRKRGRPKKTEAEKLAFKLKKREQQAKKEREEELLATTAVDEAKDEATSVPSPEVVAATPTLGTQTTETEVTLVQDTPICTAGKPIDEGEAGGGANSGEDIDKKKKKKKKKKNKEPAAGEEVAKLEKDIDGSPTSETVSDPGITAVEPTLDTSDGASPLTALQQEVTEAEVSPVTEAPNTKLPVAAPPIPETKSDITSEEKEEEHVGPTRIPISEMSKEQIEERMAAVEELFLELDEHVLTLERRQIAAGLPLSEIDEELDELENQRDLLFEEMDLLMDREAELSSTSSSELQEAEEDSEEEKKDDKVCEKKEGDTSAGDGVNDEEETSEVDLSTLFPRGAAQFASEMQELFHSYHPDFSKESFEKATKELEDTGALGDVLFGGPIAPQKKKRTPILQPTLTSDADEDAVGGGNVLGATLITASVETSSQSTVEEPDSEKTLGIKESLLVDAEKEKEKVKEKQKKKVVVPIPVAEDDPTSVNALFAVPTLSSHRTSEVVPKQRVLPSDPSRVDSPLTNKDAAEEKELTTASTPSPSPSPSSTASDAVSGGAPTEVEPTTLSDESDYVVLPEGSQ